MRGRLALPSLLAASMRPQRNAAENTETTEQATWVSGASMRPQRNAAENIVGSVRKWNANDASMRPQRNAAENREMGLKRRREMKGFNEAAA